MNTGESLADNNASEFPARISFLTYVVKDIYKSTEIFTSVFGIKHWHISEFPGSADEITIGEPNRQMYAFGSLRSTIIELIQPLSGRSVWSKFLEDKGEGLHHIGYLVADLDKSVSRLLKLGAVILEAGIVDGRRFNCIEVAPSIIVEFEENKERSTTMLF